MDKIREKYGQNMEKIWAKYGQNMGKYGQNMEKIWAKYGLNMDKILITPCRQIDSADSHETPACLTTVCEQRFFQYSVDRASRYNPCK